jgi:hypothetical protein
MCNDYAEIFIAKTQDLKHHQSQLLDDSIEHIRHTLGRRAQRPSYKRKIVLQLACTQQ